MTGIRKVPADFRPNSKPATHLMADMEAVVDLITLHDRLGRPHSYARTERGYHVPIECMRHEDIRAALGGRRGI